MFSVETIHQSMGHQQVIQQQTIHMQPQQPQQIQHQQIQMQVQPQHQQQQMQQQQQRQPHLQPQQQQPQQHQQQQQQQQPVLQTLMVVEKNNRKEKAVRAPRKPKKERIPKKPKPKKDKLTKRKTTREIIDKQGRGIVFNVYLFLKAMHLRQQCQQPVKFAKTQELTAQACGIGKRTVQRIIKEGRISLETNEQPVFGSPARTRSVTNHNRITKLDDMDCFILRRTVHDFYDQKQFPSVKQLLPLITGKINFQGSCNSLRRLLKDLGFCYRKSSDGGRFLMERADIVAARVKFLRAMHELRISDQRTIYYVGESTVDPKSMSLTYPPSETPAKPKKVSKIVICHVGSAKTGFLPQCKLVFQHKPRAVPDPNTITEMNANVFKSWFIKVLNDLTESSIIVMDNATHHSRLLDVVPSAASRKSEISEWLWRYGIPHDTKQTRVELLSLVKMHQPKSKSYELDTLAAEKGHTVVRLPPYHNQYNPIEMVWAQVKAEVTERNSTFKINDVETIVNLVLDNTSREVWEQSVRHAEQLQEADFNKELLRDQNLESFVVNLQSDSESDIGDDDEDDEHENDD